jgi:hypothetical protein
MAARPNVSAGRPGAGKVTGSSGWGRGRLTLVLVGFLLVGIVVVSRRTYGLNEEKRIGVLRSQRDALLNTETQVSDDIRQASSLSRLGPVVEQRLNMHVPKPDQLIRLERPVVATPRGGR